LILDAIIALEVNDHTDGGRDLSDSLITPWVVVVARPLQIFAWAELSWLW